MTDNDEPTTVALVLRRSDGDTCALLGLNDDSSAYAITTGSPEVLRTLAAQTAAQLGVPLRDETQPPAAAAVHTPAAPDATA